MRTVARRIPYGNISSASANGNTIILIDYGDILEQYILGFHIEAVRASVSLD